MALTKNFKLMELTDAKIAQLLTDDDSAITYGTYKDLPGALKITCSPKADTKQLKGDSTTIDVYTKITEIEFEAECAMFSLDALPILMGGTVTQTGTTPSQLNTYSFTAANATLGYFKLEGQWKYVNIGVGDAHVLLYKCKVTEPPVFEINDASGNFGTVKFKGIAFPTIKDGKWYDLIMNETAVAIS